MNTEHGNPAVVLFTWDAGNLWGKMRRCLDMAIDDAKGEEKKIKFVAEGNFKEIKVAINITGNTTETDFCEKFLAFHNDFVKGKYPNLRAIVVFADIPNAYLVNSCKKEMDYFLSRNIPIISSICGRQSLLKKGYFNCWCPSIETVARYAAYIIGNEFAARAKRWHPRIWCFYTNNDFGKKSKSIFTNWLFRTQKIGSDLVQCRLANEKCLSRDKLDRNDLVFITGFGKDYEYCTSKVVGAAEDSVYLLFDQSIADPENYLGDSGYEEYKSKSDEARQISYIDFVLPFNGFQRFNERADKFKVLPYVTFRLVDQILSSSDTFKELNTLPLIEVDGISYLMTKRHERIYAAISLLEGKLERTEGRLIEKKMLFRDDSGMVALTQERIGLLLQAVDDQLKNVSLKVSEDILLQVANEIENIFRLSLRDCDFALMLPVSVDGSKEYVSGNESLQAIARGITKIHDLGLYKNIIKISLCKQDFAEDNDIAGLYIKTAESDSSIPLKYWDKMAPVKSVVLSRDIENDECDGSYDFQYVPDKQCRKICNDLLLEILKCSINNRWHFLYFIPYEMSSGSMGVLLIATKLKFSYLDGRVLTAVASQIFSSVASGIKSKGILLASTKSAIGSIMSRNGSHNIGSHVLAALSHNVGTLPDDRVLYQYIQQRMDYIATVTTDFPTWTQPTMFVADMMKTFLSQRHLLDHIVESEGLKGFQFQNPNMDDREWADQKNCVRIHVRKVDSKGTVLEDFIKYGDKEHRNGTINLRADVALAIPGGIVGEHAFYTILENIIRNAAKHSWKKKKAEDNLDLYIDFEEENEDVDFYVYTQLDVDNHDELKKSLNDKLAQSFINEETNSLRRENWGLAEMKISAGYLADRSIEDIGGIGERKGTDDILEPRIVTWNGKNCLGYKFKIAKPKEILVIVNNKNQWADKDDVMKKKGIFAKTFDEVKKELKLNYRYIVHYDATEFFDVNTYEPKDGILIPFRMLSGRKIEDQKDGVDWKWLQPFVANLDDGKTDEGNGVSSNVSGFEQLQKAFVSGGVEKVQKIVYKAYYTHLQKARNDLWSPAEGKKSTVDIGLLVAINENEKAGGNSLISDADIIELMLEQNFATCVDQYKAFVAGDDCKKIMRSLELIRCKSSDENKVVKFKKIKRTSTTKELIAQRIYDWMKLAGDDKDDIKEHLRKKYFVRGKTDEKYTDNFDDMVNALLAKHPIDDFIRYVEVIFENTKKLFKQYEEQIVTLPAGYKVETSKVEDGEVFIDGLKIITKAGDIKEDSNQNRHWIGYRRHAHTIDVEDPAKSLYVEPLSGTQTYLSNLAKVKNDLSLQMRLVENGLMRILVLDERVAKFLREHQKEVGPHYKAMNINVIDDKCVEAGLKADSKADGFFTGYSKIVSAALEDYAKDPKKEGLLKKLEEIKNNHFQEIDILIVHQGILDKWFTDLKSVEGMKHLLEGFKRLVKYVVVTTGRGTPDNIPEEAHLLPFAVVESTLFKKYPEKLILTDTIMNVLPVGKKNATGGQA